MTEKSTGVRHLRERVDELRDEGQELVNHTAKPAAHDEHPEQRSVKIRNNLPQPIFRVFGWDDDALRQLAIRAVADTPSYTNNMGLRETAFPTRVVDQTTETTPSGNYVLSHEFSATFGNDHLRRQLVQMTFRLVARMSPEQVTKKPTQTTSPIYPQMPLAIFGHLGATGNTFFIRGGRWQVDLTGTFLSNLLPWIPRLRTQNVFALGILTECEPMTLRVAALTL
ncbi:hypothetical protein ACIBF5_29605 [Micromonospora sp. NPDC050417]|uniref:hypothetical protein n=1 Tax=Micromonospora sp. NPDC050417 TaxID=3364280 RepID=UPI0037A3C9C7